VRASQHDDVLAAYSIPDRIREAVNDRSPDIAIYNRINERRFYENGEDVRDLRLELGAETGSLGFMPDFCLSDIQFCSTSNLEVERQESFSRRFFTSAHEL
jgi:hypothetical protein